MKLQPAVCVIVLAGVLAGCVGPVPAPLAKEGEPECGPAVCRIDPATDELQPHLEEVGLIPLPIAIPRETFFLDSTSLGNWFIWIAGESDTADHGVYAYNAATDELRVIDRTPGAWYRTLTRGDEAVFFHRATEELDQLLAWAPESGVRVALGDVNGISVESDHPDDAILIGRFENKTAIIDLVNLTTGARDEVWRGGRLREENQTLRMQDAQIVDDGILWFSLYRGPDGYDRGRVELQDLETKEFKVLVEDLVASWLQSPRSGAWFAVTGQGPAYFFNATGVPMGQVNYSDGNRILRFGFSDTAGEEALMLEHFRAFGTNVYRVADGQPMLILERDSSWQWSVKQDDGGPVFVVGRTLAQNYVEVRLFVLEES